MTSNTNEHPLNINEIVDKNASLKELLSLHLATIDLEQKKLLQLERLQHIDQLMIDSQQKIQTINLNLSNAENKIKLLEAQLKKIDEQILQMQKQSDLIHNAQQQKLYEQQLENLREEKDRYENEVLHLLENIDHQKKELKIQNDKIFNLPLTKKDIEPEAQQTIVNCNQSIKSNQQRQSYLIAEFSTTEQKTIQNAIKNNAKNFLSFISKGNCHTCGYKLSSIDISQIEKDKQIKTCTMCGRILLPQHF